MLLRYDALTAGGAISIMALERGLDQVGRCAGDRGRLLVLQVVLREEPTADTMYETRRSCSTTDHTSNHVCIVLLRRPVERTKSYGQNA